MICYGSIHLSDNDNKTSLFHIGGKETKLKKLASKRRTSSSEFQKKLFQKRQFVVQYNPTKRIDFFIFPF